MYHEVRQPDLAAGAFTGAADWVRTLRSEDVGWSALRYLSGSYWPRAFSTSGVVSRLPDRLALRLRQPLRPTVRCSPPTSSVGSRE